MSVDYDVIVIGSGVAGLSTALALAGRRRVALVTAGPLGGGSTRWAQGGIAAAIGADDAPQLHAEDTAIAGAGACRPDAVAILTAAAPAGLESLVRRGTAFDRDETGALAVTREGGHHRRRVVHAGGDATGTAVSATLVRAVRGADIEVMENAKVLDLLMAARQRRQVVGAVLDRGPVAARAVVLATGGAGGLFPASTNPSDVTGVGLGLALRAGASLVDLEFVQFHPTALAVGGSIGQIPLITEALRGEGAVLRDATGARIMLGRHALADLAPRDIVARCIDEALRRDPTARVFLDATAVPALRDRFPTVAAECARHGIDPVVDPIPVVPVQHFLCGGVRTDRSGASDVDGLFAVGEVAATGLHGANRLASNSLIEGVVFAHRLADRLAAELPPYRPCASEMSWTAASEAELTSIRAAMGDGAGIRRTAAGLGDAAERLAALAPSHQAVAAAAIVTAATARTESRGCHWRDDHPTTSSSWRGSIVVRLGETGTPQAVVPAELERSA